MWRPICTDLTVGIGKLYTTIPEELLIEVLTRLPIESLARFKRVSKQWKRLILNDVPMESTPKPLIFSTSLDKPFALKNSFSFCSLNNKTYIESIRCPMEEYILNSQRVKAHSSCHGYMLFEIDDDLFMWNPQTNFCGKVLTSTISSYIHADLCYDFVNKKYKVVLVKRHYFENKIYERLYIATCGTCSWVEINVPSTIQLLVSGPFFKGYRHWLSRSPFEASYFPRQFRIFYFDPSMNEFIEVPIRQPKEGVEENVLNLGVLDGYLCLTRIDCTTNHLKDVELLVMKEYGNINSWEVMYVFPNISICGYGSMEPLFKTMEGEVWIRTNEGAHAECVKSFDTFGNFQRDIWVESPNESFKLILYEEVSINYSQLGVYTKP